MTYSLGIMNKDIPQVGDIVMPIGIFKDKLWNGKRAEVIKDSISDCNTNQIIVKLANGQEHYINVDYVKVIFRKKKMKGIL